jgi:hypothetical protein
MTLRPYLGVFERRLEPEPPYLGGHQRGGLVRYWYLASGAVSALLKLCMVATQSGRLRLKWRSVLFSCQSVCSPCGAKDEMESIRPASSRAHLQSDMAVKTEHDTRLVSHAPFHTAQCVSALAMYAAGRRFGHVGLFDFPGQSILIGSRSS